MPKNNLLYTQRFLHYCTWLLIAASILSIYYAVQQAKAADLQQNVQPQAVTVGEVPAENVALLGHIGGENYAMQVQGSYAYLGLGPELAVLDISDPDRPKRLGYWVFPDIINGIEVVGGFAYVTDEANKFWIVDISDPNNPRPLYETNTPDVGRTIHVQGGVAYIVLQNGSLWLADISTPSAITEIGLYNPTGDIQDIYIAGDVAYLATADTGLGVVDISDPAVLPTEITYYDAIGDAGKLYLDGNRLYVVDWGNSVWIIDVSAPTSPRELGIYETMGGNIFVAGSVAYVTDEFMGLTLVDLTNPNSPTQLGAHPDINFVNQIAVQDTFAYMTDDRGLLQVMDVANMSTPQLRGTYQTLVSAGKIHVDGATAFVGDPSGRLALVDITDPANPVGQSSLTTFVSDVYAASGKAYVAGSSDGLRIIDGADSANPTELGAYNIYAPAKGIHVTSDVAYIATGSQGLRIVDVADPANVTELALYDTPGNAEAVYIAGGASGILAYVADEDSGLQIIDVTVPSQPTTLGAYDNPDRDIINVYVADTMAYLVDSRGGLSIVDVSIPSSPRELGTYDDASGIAQSVYAVGSTLYVADGTNGLQVVNVATPSAPVLVGSYSLPGNASDVVVDQNNVVYVTGKDGGLFVLKYANAGTQPAPTSTFTPRPIPTATPTFTPTNSATAMPTVQPSATGVLVETPTGIATGIATEIPTAVTTAIPTPTTDPGGISTTTPSGCVAASVSINAPESVAVGDIFNVQLSFTGTGEQWWYVSQHESAPNIEIVVDGSEYRALLPGEVTYWIGLDSDCGESAMKTVIIKVLESSASTPVATSNATSTPTFTPTATPTLAPEPTDTPFVCIPPAISISAPEEVFVGETFTAILSFSGTGNQWWYLDQDEADPVVATITEGSVYQALRAGEIIFRTGIDSPCVTPIIEAFNIVIVERPTATATDTGTATATETATVTPTPTMTWTLAPNVTPSDMTSTPIPTLTLTPTLTPTLIPTMTPTIISTVTPASGPTETCLLPTLTENIPESVQIGETFALDLVFSGTGTGWWYVDQDENDPIIQTIIDGQVYKAFRAGEVIIRAGIDSPCSDPVNRSYTVIVGDLSAATPDTTATVTPTEESTMIPTTAATLDSTLCTPPIVNFTSPEEIKLGEMLTFSLSFQNAESEWWYVDQEPRNPLVKAIDPDGENKIGYQYETLRAGEVIIRAGATSSCTSPVSKSWIVVVIDETTPTPTGSVITPDTTSRATSEATLITLSTATLTPTLTPTLTRSLTPTPENVSNYSLTGTIAGNQQQRQPISGPLPYALNLENNGITTLTNVVLILDSEKHLLDSANPSNRNWQQVGDQYHLSIGDINSDGTMTTVFYVNPVTPDIVVTDPEDSYLQIDAPEITVHVEGQPFAVLVPTGEKLIWCCLPLASTLHTIYLPLITR